MPANPRRRPRAIATLLAVVALALLSMPASSSAQAIGQVHLRIVKAGLVVGGGAGSGVLIYRGRSYRFEVSGLSVGLTVGATVGRFDGWASGISDISDFAGTYSSVGGGFALGGGVNGVHLRNEKGVTIVLQGPKLGLELAANLSAITIALK
jgi:hypothetical protein